VIGHAVRYLDERAGAAPFFRKALRYVFPDHWSFLLGEVALYSFVILVGTGVYLTLFFKPSLAPVHYHGEYLPLRGHELSEAYRSTVDISLRIKAGLLIRQTHHWAADVFVAAIVLHLLRIFFTGAFRKPRDLTYYVGLVMLIVALLEGYLGYSLVDDLVSGMGLAIGYSVLMSLPFVGANIAQLLWDGPFPGSDAFESRMYVAHVLVFPVLIGALIALHLTLVAARHHTQFQGRRATEQKVVGMPTFPAYAPRSLGLAFACCF
jgi:ubiquinol-cytochrome c reductase cytochrome b subunit